MLPHLKKWTKEEKEKARKLFFEDRRIRQEILKNQSSISKEEMMRQIQKKLTKSLSSRL